MRREVLCVAGPMDGRWHPLSPGQMYFEAAAAPEPVNVVVTELPGYSFERVVYHVERLNLFGFQLEVAVCEDELIGFDGKNRAVLRAVLQRDVAQHMRVWT